MHGRALALQRGERASVDVVQQVVDRCDVAGHRVGQREVGVARVAVHPGLFLAQAQDVARHLAVVRLACILAAADPGLPRPLAQVAPRGEREEGHDQGARQRHHVPAFAQVAIDGRLARGRAHERRQAVEFGVGQFELEAGLVGQHVLREARGELRQAFHDLRVARLLVRAQLRAGAHEVKMQALDEPQRLGVQLQVVARGMHRVEPGEQAGVHHHGAVVRGQRAGQLALHGLDLGRGVRRGQRVERGLDARQQPAAAIEGRHGVVEVGGRRLRGDRLHLGALRLHRRLEGRGEIRGPDQVERGQCERRRPVGEKGIGGGHGVVCGLLRGGARFRVVPPCGGGEAGDDASATRLRHREGYDPP